MQHWKKGGKKNSKRVALESLVRESLKKEVGREKYRSQE